MEDIEKYPDRVAELFAGKTLFITGATGFMGKVLIEKLLRSCTDLNRIYILIRVKKGKNAQDRLKDLFANPLFDLLKKTHSDRVLSKVVAVAGDVSTLGLGLSPEDRLTLINEVNIIYHCAASVRFDEPLKSAVLLNTRGTKLMIELAHELKQLLLFCHVSTAYCHLHERMLYEKPYPPPTSPDNVIKTVEWMDDEVIESITDKILGNFPNTYAFTKALGEGLINEQLDKLPMILCRPSVVVPIWKEPLPGWTDNINGPTGLLIGAGKGVIRTMYCNSERYADFLPVDIAVNGLLCASWDHLTYKQRRIYNLTSSAEYKVSWEQIIEIGREVINKRIPLNWVVWYPGGSMKRNKLLHYLAVLFFHLLPAVILDALLLCMGYKPVLWKIQQRIIKGFEVFEYYANNQWDFHNEGSLEARKNLNPKEMKIYKLNGEGLDYHDYFTDCVHAARLYILKEPDSTIKTAKRHMRIMYYVDIICKSLIIFGFFYLLFTKLVKPLFGSQ